MATDCPENCESHKGQPEGGREGEKQLAETMAILHNGDCAMSASGRFMAVGKRSQTIESRAEISNSSTTDLLQIVDNYGESGLENDGN